MSARRTGPSALVSVYSGSSTIGRRRHWAAMASSSRVAAFSRARSAASSWRQVWGSVTGGRAGVGVVISVLPGGPAGIGDAGVEGVMLDQVQLLAVAGGEQAPATALHVGDRKSTRLNSSHVAISYAFFC